MTMRGAVLVAMLAAACRPEPEAKPPVTAAARTNTASELARAASEIVLIEIVALDDRRVIATCDAALLDAVRESIARGVQDGVTATPPAWPVALRLATKRGAPFVTHLVGHDRLRVCPEDPWTDCGNAAEVAVPFELFEDVARKVGMPPRREYQTGDAPEL